MAKKIPIEKSSPVLISPASIKTKIIGTKELIKSTVSDFRRNWQKFAYLLLIPLIISFLISLSSFALKYFSVSYPLPWPAMALGFLVFFAVMIAVGVLYVLTYISEFLLLKDFSQEVSFRNLRAWYGRAKPFFWIFLAVSIIYCVLSLLGLILLIVPGLIFMVSYSMTVYAVVFEDHKFEGAFGRSRELVKGYWWAVFGRFMAGGTLAYIAYIIIGGIYSGIVWLIFLALQITPSRESFSVMYDFLALFIGLVAGPLSMIYTYRIYRSLRETKNI